MTLPCWKARNVLARMDRARNSAATCPSSRHAAMLARDLMRGHRGLLADDPEHCGVSIGVTVELLWKARAENAALRRQLSELRDSVTNREGGR